MAQKIDLDNNEFQQVWQLIEHTSSSIFMTGKAGTGKSTFLRYITANTSKKYVVLAPTGIAAVNAGGQTIHSFFHIPFKPIVPDDPEFAVSRLRERMKYPKSFRKLLKSIDLIIIDEISMVRVDIIDFIDKLLKHFCGNWRQPFGGKQMLFVGDVFQLEPVVPADVRDILRRYYKTFYFFGATVFNEFTLVPIELRKVYRQTDSDFVNLLDRVRDGHPLPQDIDTLNSRVRPLNIEKNDSEEFSMTIATRKDIVDSINESHLARLTTRERTYIARTTGEFPESNFPTSRELTFKTGAQVVFIRNDRECRWVNGTIGRISAVNAGSVEVTLETGEVYDVEPEGWDNITYTYDEEKHSVVENIKGSFIQLPLRLAWALTIHKSQGLTFNKVNINLGNGSFSGGQTYVALSRCTSLEGITLAAPVRERDIYVNPQVAEFSRKFNNAEIVSGAFREARADLLYAEAAIKFKQGDYSDAVTAFSEAVDIRNDLTKQTTRRFIAQRLYNLAGLSFRAQIAELESKLQAQAKILADLAEEFTILGSACLKEESEVAPALANFEKAIRLNPDAYTAIIGRSACHIYMNDTDTAAEILADACRRFPKRHEAYYELGSLYLSIGNIESAILHLKKAQRISPTLPEVQYALAEAFDNAGDAEQAERHRARAKALENKRKKKK